MTPTARRLIPVIAVLSNGRVLMLQRREDSKYPNLWCIPGGKQEVGETYHETASRELREETGIAIEPLDLIHHETVPAKSRDDLDFAIFTVSLATRPSVTIEQAAFQGYGWFTLDEAVAMNNVVMEPALKTLSDLIG